MKPIILNEHEYELIENYKNAFNYDELVSKYTEYFDDYDYVLGDYSYDKLRLKGFCKKDNEKFSAYNDYEKIQEYLKDYCSYDCRYFVLENKKSKK